MKKSEAIDRITKCRHALAALKDSYESWTPLEKWRRDTEVATERIFGPDTRHLVDLKRIHFSPMVRTHNTTEHGHHEAYVTGIQRSEALLDSFMEEIDNFWVEHNPAPLVADVMERLRTLCNRFHLVVRQLRSRHAGRPSFEVDDEYDVQDLLHALLLVDFDDVRPEDPSPSYAGGASRPDFLLKAHEIVVEVKKSRDSMTAKKLGEELLIDIQRYQAHPACKRLLCFVYDPEGRIANPRGLERDLSGTTSGIEVIVIIAP